MANLTLANQRGNVSDLQKRLFFSTAGSRTFNVSINGTQLLSVFDIFAAAGAKNKAIIEEFTVNANSTGQYVVQFTSVVNQSLLSGIEVQ